MATCGSRTESILVGRPARRSPSAIRAIRLPAPKKSGEAPCRRSLDVSGPSARCATASCCEYSAAGGATVRESIEEQDDGGAWRLTRHFSADPSTRAMWLVLGMARHGDFRQRHGRRCFARQNSNRSRWIQRARMGRRCSVARAADRLRRELHQRNDERGRKDVPIERSGWREMDSADHDIRHALNGERRLRRR